VHNKESPFSSSTVFSRSCSSLPHSQNPVLVAYNIPLPLRFCTQCPVGISILVVVHHVHFIFLYPNSNEEFKWWSFLLCSFPHIIPLTPFTQVHHLSQNSDLKPFKVCPTSERQQFSHIERTSIVTAYFVLYCDDAEHARPHTYAASHKLMQVPSYDCTIHHFFSKESLGFSLYYNCSDVNNFFSVFHNYIHVYEPG
jgi:hypothetical protein